MFKSAGLCYPKLSFSHISGVLSPRVALAPHGQAFHIPFNTNKGSTNRRAFSRTSMTMSNVQVELTAPNGRKYTQPIGLFINNEFVPSSDGEKFATVNPSCVTTSHNSKEGCFFFPYANIHQC